MLLKTIMGTCSLLILTGLFLNRRLPDPLSNPTSDSGQKIILNEDMVINEAALGEAWKLVDEQSLIGDPANGTGKAAKTRWHIDYQKKDYFPVSAVIDLGRYYELSHIYLFDAEGKGKIEVSTGIPFSWNLAFKSKLDQYNTWVKNEVKNKTRFVQIKLFSNASMPEIAIYGKPSKKQPDNTLENTGSSKNLPKIKMQNFIGINAFIDDPLEKIFTAGFVREYHVWSWDEADHEGHPGYPDNKNAWNPSSAGGGWNFDEYYKKLHEAGVVIATCIQGSPGWLDLPLDGKPARDSLDPENPFSYKEHADHMFQVTARYGSTKVPHSLLKIADNQPIKSGLGYVQYYENWNEPDKDWKTREEYFSPYEYAAMTSADYDGHLQKMGKTFGVKNADPKSKLVMAGIASLNLDYIKSIKFWSEWNRSGSIPFDVINLHHYSNDGGKQRSLGKVGISPEDDSLKQKLERFVKYRDTHMPGKEVWITEFGYDTNETSIQRAPAIGSYSMEEVQAIWLVRSFMAIKAAGVDRAAIYMLRDTETNSGIQFSKSGLTSSKSQNFVAKPSWYYVNTLKHHLMNHIFYRDLSENGIMKYQFRIPNEKKEALVMWVPTSKGVEAQEHKVSIPSNAKNATLVNFVNNSTTGAVEKLARNKNSVNVKVSEKPIIITYEL